jgi:hypothetical protein
VGRSRLGTLDGTGFARVLAAGWSGGLLVETVREIVVLSPQGFDDLDGYLAGARRFVETGSPYLPSQVAGPWTLGPHSFIHPPAALALFVPFLVLPAFLWWAIPLGITTFVIIRFWPAPWTWPLKAACLVWPRSSGSLLAGNTDMWAMAFVAAGAMWGWPAALLAVKPTVAPLALIGGRRALLAGLIVIALCAALLPLWIQYAAVIGNVGVDWTYSLLNLPLVVLPAIAWLGRQPPVDAVPTGRAPTANRAGRLVPRGGGRP